MSCIVIRPLLAQSGSVVHISFRADRNNLASICKKLIEQDPAIFHPLLNVNS